MAASTWSSRRGAMEKSGARQTRSWPLRFRRIILSADGSESGDMAHTFDIRFAHGVGLLSIDAQGLSVAPRGLLAWLSRRPSRRIPAASLKEVYREGDSLRVEFATADNPREVLPFRV